MLEEDFVWHCWVILQGMRASKVSCFAMAKGEAWKGASTTFVTLLSTAMLTQGSPQTPPPPWGWMFWYATCKLHCNDTWYGTWYGTEHTSSRAHTTYSILPWWADWRPASSFSSLRVNKSPPLASHIFNQPSCSHSHALSNNNKHFNAGLLLLLLCIHLGDKLCLMRQRKWDGIKLRPVVPGWGQ